MTIEQWWNAVKDDAYWSGAITGIPWDQLWPDAQERLEAIFELARQPAPDLNPETIFHD
jgi:hypothetical protein